MDTSLRKTHRRIWIVFAVILPVLFIAAVIAIPKGINQEVLYQDVDPVQLQQKDSEDSIKMKGNE